MTGFPNGGPWPAITKEVSKPNRRSLIAVISYVGKHAPELLPLRRGDWLVCDASPIAIRQQLSNTDALLKFHRKGVVVFSVQGLHAKVVSSPTSAWIGSANASNNSATNLVEASIRVSGDQARQLHSWAKSLATEDHALSLKELKALAALPKIAMRPGPQRKTIPTELPKTWKKLEIIGTERDHTAIGAKRVKADRINAKIDAKSMGQPLALSSIRYSQGTSLKVGDWVVELTGGHARTPGIIVRVSTNGSEQIVWISRPKTVSKPSIKILREILPRLVEDEEDFTIRDPNVLARIHALYE
jgi:hypothetical protein